jgi:hypothetical protein
VTNKDKNKSEVFLLLSTALKDFENNVASDVGNMYTILSEALAAQGFQTMGLKFDKKKKKATIITVNLFSAPESRLLGTECDIPFYDTVTLIECNQWFSKYFSGLPLLSQYTPPPYGVALPINDVLLVVTSDTITEDVLPAFSVFNDLVKSFILFLE